MTLPSAAVFNWLDLAVLHAASLLMPARQREEWWKEWRAELWHVRQARTPSYGISWTAEQAVVMFCLGAFQDALCLRVQLGRRPVLIAATRGSAAQCVLFLVGLIAVSYGVALLLPGVSLARHSAHFHDAQNLVLIQDAGYPGDFTPTVSVEQYQAWKRRRQNIFDEIAFYKVIRESVSSARHTTPAAARIAVASPNLFATLGIPIRLQTLRGDRHDGLPRLILSDEMWKREFHESPDIFGSVIHLGLSAAVVDGVAPQGAWRLPGNVEGWLLVHDDTRISEGEGFVVAHVKASGQHAWGENWRMSAPDRDGKMADFSCISLAERTRRPLDLFLFSLFLACVALPATTSLPLGEYRITSQKLSWSMRLRRWGFLGCKIALLLPIVYFVSLDLSYLHASVSPFAENLQISSSFLICLFGLRWVLRDQRQRCPVCLRRLTNPARVGQPSRNFLAWNGTELVCMAGHGLLHIPEIETSWFDTQRWLYLDPSWDILFADSGLVSAGYF